VARLNHSGTLKIVTEVLTRRNSPSPVRENDFRSQ